jgi:hypothetical protein
MAASWIRERRGVPRVREEEEEEADVAELVPPPEWHAEQFESLLQFIERQEGFRTELLEFSS